MRQQQTRAATSAKAQGKMHMIPSSVVCTPNTTHIYIYSPDQAGLPDAVISVVLHRTVLGDGHEGRLRIHPPHPPSAAGDVIFYPRWHDDFNLCLLRLWMRFDASSAAADLLIPGSNRLHRPIVLSRPRRTLKRETEAFLAGCHLRVGDVGDVIGPEKVAGTGRSDCLAGHHDQKFFKSRFAQSRR